MAKRDPLYKNLSYPELQAESARYKTDLPVVPMDRRFWSRVDAAQNYLAGIIAQTPEHQRMDRLTEMEAESTLSALYGMSPSQVRARKSLLMTGLTGNSGDDRSFLTAFADAFSSYDRSRKLADIENRILKTDDEEELGRLEAEKAKIQLAMSVPLKDLDDRGPVSKALFAAAPILNQGMKAASVALLANAAAGVPSSAAGLPVARTTGLGAGTGLVAAKTADGGTAMMLKGIAAKYTLGTMTASSGAPAVASGLASAHYLATTMFPMAKGMTALELEQYKDADGRGLDKKDIDYWSSVEGFFETILEVATVTPFTEKLLQGLQLTPHEIGALTLRNMIGAARGGALELAQKIHGESLEEGLQGGWAEFVKQAARVVSDKTKGTSFGTKIDVGKIFQQTLEDYTASLVPMGIDMFASQGLSFAMRLPLDAKMVSDANGRFERSGDVANIDSIGTYGLIPTKKDVATVQGTEGSRQAATSNETGKRKPFDVYEDKYGGLHAVYQEDAQAIRDMKRDGVTGVRVNVINREGSGSPLANLADGDKRSFARFAEEAGSALGASGIGEDKQGRHVLVFQDKEGMKAAYAQLRGEAMDTDIDQDGTRAVVSFVQRAENGNTAYQELVLTTREDEVAEGMHVPEDTFEDDMADMELERPLSVAMLDQDSAVSAQEVRALRTKLRDNYGITGRKNKAAAQAYAVASSILHVPSLDLADRLRIVFEGDEAARAELRENGFSEERGANGWMTNEGGGFTIHLTRTATPATLFHETGHIVRALASADQLADVERVYGVQGHQWTRNAEERFADDFVRYLRTRQAPTAKIRYLFDQIRKLLSYITGGKYAESLSDETARAFERLWTGKADEGVLKENGSGQKTLMEMSPEKQELIQRLSDKSLYQQDQEEKHLYIHPERTALARKNKREQAVHAKETDMARRLANHYGVDVFLLPPDVSEGNMLVLKGKNPDGIVNGVFFDAKQPISNSERSIQNNLRQGVKQGDLVYMDFSVAGTPMEDALRSIKGQIAMPEEDYEGKRLVLTNASGLFEEYMIRKKELVKSSFLGSPGLSPRSDSNIASNFESVKSDVLAQAADTPSMAEVRRKYEGTDKWLKAPNGKQTSLTERQWLQVRTPEFKQWFGDWEDDPEHASKVADGNGEPLVVYHGTGERFEVFDRSLIGESTSNDGIWGKGFYFTPDMDLAQEYAEGAEGPDAHVEGTFLKMAEPYGMDQSVLDTPFSDAELAAAKDAREKADGDSGSPYALLSYSMQDAQLVDMYRKISKGERFDGVVYRGEEDFRGFNRDEYVVPSSNQIKSATDNNGQFDNGNDSILFQLTDKETTDMVRQVDSLTKQDIGKPNAAIDISSHTPFVFRELGLDDLKVVMYRGKLARGLYLPEGRRHGHSEGLDKGIVKKVLESFADPVYVFDSRTDVNSLVAVYDVLDKHDNPMMASVTIDKNASQVLVDLVTSIYGKTRRKYQSWVDSGLLRYADDIRKNLPDSARLQLPSKPEGSYRDNIIYKSQLVNKPGAFFELAEDEDVSSKPLFELTDEQRDGFVKKWRTDVERAVRGYEVVPTRVLEQFRGEGWADEELALREAVMDDPELWRMAEEAQDPDQLRQTLKDALEDEHGMEDNPLYDEEEVREHKRQRELLQQALASLDPSGKGATGDWVARLYWYTRTKTQDERDQEFLRTYASGKEGVLKLKAAIGKGYQTPVLSKRVRSKTGDKTYYGMQNHWPAYKGISQKVLHLPAGATDAQVQEAIDKIRENPRRYRQVLDFVESNNAYAQTVMEGMGRGDDGIMDSYQARTAAIESDEDLKKLEASGAKTLAQLSDEERNTPVGQLAGTGDEKESKETLSQKKTAAAKKAGEAKTAAEEAKAKLEKEQKETARQQKALEKYKKSLDDFLDQTNKELDGKGKAKAGRDAKAYKTKYQALLRKLWLENERKPDYDRLKQNADFLQAYGEEKARQVTQKQTEIWNLEKDLEDRRKRVRVLRRELTEANETARKLEEHSASLERRLSASRVRQAARALIASIKRLSGPSDSIDADVNGALSIVRQVTGSKLAVGQETAIESDAGTYGAKGLSQLEFYLAQTDHPEVAGLIRDRVRTSQWTVEQLLALREAVRTMRKDAREALASRQAQTRRRRQGVLAGYFKELTGQNAPVYAMTDSQGNINPKGEQLNPYAMRDDIIRSIPEADRTDSAVKKFWNSYRGVWAKMQRIARILDGDKEGVLYDFLVRQAYFANTAQIRNVNARLADGGEAMRRFGVTAEQLDEKLYTYEKGATKVELTRGEVIGLYVYGQNEIEAKKLYSISGNGISPLEAADAISKLTEGEKAWGDWMISDFARNRGRIEQAYYEQFNKELGSRDRYFPMVGDGTKVGVGEEDTLAGPTAIKREQQRTRVNRDFTKEANENAIYPLKLDVTGSWYSQVAKEEHFLAWNEWVQDAQFLLGQTGGLAGMIRQKYGKAMASLVQDYANDMAYTFNQMSDFERMLNSFLSHSAVGSLAYNLVTAAKQAPSAAASIGNTSAANWMKAGEMLASSRRAQTLAMIYRKAPDIAKRYIDLDVMRAKGRKDKVGRFLDNAGKSEKPWQGMWLANAVDRSVVAQMWLASYWTNIEDGMGEREAVFKASQVISETQPTTQPTDLSYIQRKWRDPIRRAAIMFTNQTFQLWNMACIDLPMYLRQREFRRALPIIANLACNAAAMVLISGVWLPKKGDDDDGEKKRRRIVRELMANLASSIVPLAGGALSEGVRGFYGGDGGLLADVGRMMRKIADGTVRMKDVLDLAKDAGSSFLGTPTNAINRVTKAVSRGEIMYLLGPNWGEWQENRR